MKKKYIPIGLVLILLIGITIYYFYPRTITILKIKKTSLMRSSTKF